MLRRSLRVIGLVAMLTLASCGGGSSPGSTSNPAPSEPATTRPAPPAEVATPRATTEPTDAFPVTIRHEYGSTVVPREPQRVVALSNRFGDAAFALG